MQVSRVIEAPAAAAWAVLTDTDAWPRWGPTVRAVDPHQPLGPGATGHVHVPLGLRLPYHVTVWEPDRRWAWTVAGVPATDHVVVPLGPHRCRVVFGIPRWAPPYAVVCLLALRRLEAELS